MERVYALLWHRTEGRISLDQFLDTPEWVIVNCWCRPSSWSDPAKPYWPQACDDMNNPSIGELSLRELFFLPMRLKAMREAGWTDEEMEKRFQEYSKDQFGPTG